MGWAKVITTLRSWVTVKSVAAKVEKSRSSGALLETAMLIKESSSCTRYYNTYVHLSSLELSDHSRPLVVALVYSPLAILGRAELVGEIHYFLQMTSLLVSGPEVQRETCTEPEGRETHRQTSRLSLGSPGGQSRTLPP